MIKTQGGIMVVNKRATAVNSAGAAAGAGDHGIVMTNYDENINMYTDPPQSTISLHEFFSIALSRLQVLKKIEFMYDSNSNEEAIK